MAESASQRLTKSKLERNLARALSAQRCPLE